MLGSSSPFPVAAYGKNQIASLLGWAFFLNKYRAVLCCTQYTHTLIFSCLCCPGNKHQHGVRNARAIVEIAHVWDEKQRDQTWSKKVYSLQCKPDMCESERGSKNWGGRTSDHAAAPGKSQSAQGGPLLQNCP